MKTRTIATLVAGAFLLILLQLVSGLIGPWFGVACGLLLAPVAFSLFHFFEVEFEQRWIEPLVPVVSSLAGVTILYFGSLAGNDPTVWLAPPAAALAGGLIVAIRNMSSRRCALCSRRIGGGVAFHCPRCGLLVCEQNCWVFEHCRCRLCDENRVTVFTPDGRWWDKQFGPRVSYGRCQICMTPAEDIDLRVCGKCGRPQCRECWDFANGQCSRCHWVLADLPEHLRPFVTGPVETPRPRR
jgi:hypothetical protein